MRLSFPRTLECDSFSGPQLVAALQATEVRGVTGRLQLSAGQHEQQTGFTLSNILPNISRLDVGLWNPDTGNVSLTPGIGVYWGPNASGTHRDSHWPLVGKYLVASPALGAFPPLHDSSMCPFQLRLCCTPTPPTSPGTAA
jgi:hypothetical protein